MPTLIERVAYPRRSLGKNQPALVRVQAGLAVDDVVRLEQRWPLPSARWIGDHIAFAPGMAAMVCGLGTDRARVLDAFVTALERDQGAGEVSLSAIAHAGIATKPAR